jgi:amino acid transporter
MLLLVYAFTGFEMAVVPAGEIRDVQRILPRAILTGIMIIAVIYILIQVVSVGTLSQLASSERPLADAALMFLGPYGAAFLSAGVVVSVLANLNIVLLAAARLPFAMALRGELPAFLGRTHAEFATPHWSTLVTAGVVLGLTISGSFIYGVAVSTVARLIIYGGTCLALPVLRGRPSAPVQMFTVPGGTAISVLALVVTTWLLANSSLREATHTGIAAVLGLGAYAVCSRRGAKSHR